MEKEAGQGRPHRFASKRQSRARTIVNHDALAFLAPAAAHGSWKKGKQLGKRMVPSSRYVSISLMVGNGARNDNDDDDETHTRERKEKEEEEGEKMMMMVWLLPEQIPACEKPS